MAGLRRERLEQFTAWATAHVTGDEKGQAQIFLDRLFQAFGQPGCLDVGGTAEFRIRKAKEDGGGTAFADYVWKPVVLIEMKKRGEDLARHYRQAFAEKCSLISRQCTYDGHLGWLTSDEQFDRLPKNQTNGVEPIHGRSDNGKATTVDVASSRKEY